MPTLYKVLLSRPVRGHANGPVKAVPAVFAGHWRTEENDLVCADLAAVRECLPTCYRKSFDRGVQAYYPVGGDRPGYFILRGVRGQWLNTVYLQPYLFDAHVEGTVEHAKAEIHGYMSNALARAGADAPTAPARRWRSKAP